MRVDVVAVPEPGIGVTRGAHVREVPEGVHDELDGRGGVGDEDEVVVFRVGAEETEGLEARVVDDLAGEFGRG